MRFKSFQEDWKKERIGDYINEVKFYTSNFEEYPLFTFSIENGVTPKTDRYERGFLVKKEGDTFKVIQKNQFLMNPMNLRFGAINYSKIEKPVSVSGYYDIFEIEKKKNNDFWHGLLSNNKALKMYNSISTGSLIEKKRVHFSQLINMKLYLPSFPEREKISLFLALINQRIEAQNKIIEKLESLKIGLKERIFLSGKDKESFAKILHEKTEKSTMQNQYPVLSSTVKGLFLQSEYFDRSVASENNIGYKIVKKGQIIISPQNLWMGNLTINEKYDNGIVSPSYKIYEIDKAYSKKYIYWLLTSKRSFFNYSLVSEQGASIVRRNLNFDAFMELWLPVIKDVNTQQKIDKLIDSIEKKIDSEKKRGALLNKQKSFLLSNLFI